MNKNITLIIEGLFDDLYDIDQENNLTVEIGDEYLSSLAYNTPLKPVVYKLLNVDKPRGFKFVKADPEKQEYEKFQYISDSTYDYSVYTKECNNLLNANNWITYNVSLPHDFKEKKYINDFIKKYSENGKNKILAIKVSPDETLIYAKILYNYEENWKLQKTVHILTFTGLSTNNILFSTKETKDALKIAKITKKKITNFKKFVAKNNGLERFKQYTIKIDKDNYPFMIITSLNKNNLLGVCNMFKKAYYYYKEIPVTNPDSIKEIISVNNNYLHLYFIEDKKHTYSNQDFVTLIKLTDEGKQKFDMTFN